MPKDSRLSRANFKEMRGFKRVQGRFFSLSFGVIPGRLMPGAACIVSRKVASSAVRRNALKRRCRAILSKSLRGISEPLVIVCIAKNGATERSFDEIRSDIEHLVARATTAR